MEFAGAEEMMAGFSLLSPDQVVFAARDRSDWDRFLVQITLHTHVNEERAYALAGRVSDEIGTVGAPTLSQFEVGSLAVECWVWRPDSTVALAMTAGVLGGEVEGDVAHVWLDATRSVDRRRIICPPGFSAQPDPLRLTDVRGASVATVGERVGMGGGYFERGWFASNLYPAPSSS